MHYCFHLFTKEFLTEGQIDEILLPYSEDVVFGNEDEDKEYPVFTWDWWQIGGRYGGKLKLKVDVLDEKYQWQFMSREPREGRLFHSKILREIRSSFPDYLAHEEYYFPYMGDGSFLFVDGAKISDLVTTEDLGCFGFIDIDGTAYCREQWDNKKHTFIEHDDFDSRYGKLLKDRSDCFLTVLDIHD